MSIDYIYDYMDDDDLLKISQKIKETEMLTSAEIVVSIKKNKPLLKKKVPLKTLAYDEFLKLGLNNTVDKTGILIFIILDSHEFHIITDEGVNKFFSQNTWESLIENIQSSFREGEFRNGLVKTVELIGETVKDKLPIKPNDINEISNKIRIS